MLIHLYFAENEHQYRQERAARARKHAELVSEARKAEPSKPLRLRSVLAGLLSRNRDRRQHVSKHGQVTA